MDKIFLRNRSTQHHRRCYDKIPHANTTTPVNRLFLSRGTLEQPPLIRPESTQMFKTSQMFKTRVV